MAVIAGIILANSHVPVLGQSGDGKKDGTGAALSAPSPDGLKPADDSKPSSTNIGNSPYPRVHSDGRATFRLKAPDAKRYKYSRTTAWGHVATGI